MRPIKNTSYKSKTKSFKNGGTDTMVSRRYIPFSRGSTLRDINYQLVVYSAYNTTSGASYTLSNANPSLWTYDVLAAVFASQEFIDLQDQFACYCIEGFHYTYSSSLGPGLTSVQALPPMFLATNYGNTGSVNVTNVARSDASVELKMNSVSAGKQIIQYELPPVLFGYHPAIIAGSSVWFSTASPIASGTLNLMIGYLQVPTFLSTASNQFIPVGVIDVHVKVKFAQPILD